MQTPRRVPTGTGPTRRGMRWVGGRLRDPAVLTVIAVVFFVSAVGQSLAQAYLHEDSVVAVTAFSVAGSLFLAAAVIVAARRHERASRTPPSPRQDEVRVESGDLEEVHRLLADDLHSELTDRLRYVRQLAADKDTSVAAGREYAEAMLGFQVYANQVYRAVHSDPHGEYRHGG